MRNFRHWTPRYIRDRIALFTFEKSNPNTPWLTPRAIELLDGLLVKGDVGLEWGSGRSTTWFARRLRHLTSVEDSSEWYAKVRSKLEADRLINVDYVLSATGEGGFQSPYVLAASSLPNESLGFVLVDGQLREFCANVAIEKLAPGGVLVVDNANWFLDRPTKSPASRTGKGPLNDQWGEFERRTTGWRSIWTSSGITDTGFWLKP